MAVYFAQLSRIGKQCLLLSKKCVSFFLREHEDVHSQKTFLLQPRKRKLLLLVTTNCPFIRQLLSPGKTEGEMRANLRIKVHLLRAVMSYCRIEELSLTASITWHDARHGSEWPERASYKMTNHGLVVQQSRPFSVEIGMVCSMLAWHGTDGTYGI